MAFPTHDMSSSLVPSSVVIKLPSYSNLLRIFRWLTQRISLGTGSSKSWRIMSNSSCGKHISHRDTSMTKLSKLCRKACVCVCVLPLNEVMSSVYPFPSEELPLYHSTDQIKSPVAHPPGAELQRIWETAERYLIPLQTTNKGWKLVTRSNNEGCYN